MAKTTERRQSQEYSRQNWQWFIERASGGINEKSAFMTKLLKEIFKRNPELQPLLEQVLPEAIVEASRISRKLAKHLNNMDPQEFMQMILANIPSEQPLQAEDVKSVLPEIAKALKNMKPLPSFDYASSAGSKNGSSFDQLKQILEGHNIFNPALIPAFAGARGESIPGQLGKETFNTLKIFGITLFGEGKESSDVGHLLPMVIAGLATVVGYHVSIRANSIGAGNGTQTETTLLFAILVQAFEYLFIHILQTLRFKKELFVDAKTLAIVFLLIGLYLFDFFFSMEGVYQDGVVNEFGKGMMALAVTVGPEIALNLFWKNFKHIVNSIFGKNEKNEDGKNESDGGSGGEDAPKESDGGGEDPGPSDAGGSSPLDFDELINKMKQGK